LRSAAETQTSFLRHHTLRPPPVLPPPPPPPYRGGENATRTLPRNGVELKTTEKEKKVVMESKLLQIPSLHHHVPAPAPPPNYSRTPSPRNKIFLNFRTGYADPPRRMSPPPRTRPWRQPQFAPCSASQQPPPQGWRPAHSVETALGRNTRLSGCFCSPGKVFCELTRLLTGSTGPFEGGRGGAATRGEGGVPSAHSGD